MTKLTRSKFDRMPLHSQYAAYVSHENNQGYSEKHPNNAGLSLSSQNRLWNNWRKELNDFSWTLPKH